MAIKFNEWSPDTCECNIRFQWDDSLPQEQIVLSVNVVGRACEFHKHLLPNHLITYNTVLDENAKKNQTLDIALNRQTNKLADAITGEDGSSFLVLKNGIRYLYSFSGVAPNRVLTAQFIGANLTRQDKQDIQNEVNNRFGNGVAIIA